MERVIAQSRILVLLHLVYLCSLQISHYNFCGDWEMNQYQGLPTAVSVSFDQQFTTRYMDQRICNESHIFVTFRYGSVWWCYRTQAYTWSVQCHIPLDVTVYREPEMLLIAHSVRCQRNMLHKAFELWLTDLTYVTYIYPRCFRQFIKPNIFLKLTFYLQPRVSCRVPQLCQGGDLRFE